MKIDFKNKNTANKISYTLLGTIILLSSACSVGMRQSLSGQAMDPESVIARFDSLGQELRTNKQIFRVRLIDKGRSFSGDGALVYRAPDTLQLSIYGPPFTTLWLQMLTRGDSLTLFLPKENRVVRASSGDPRPVAQLAGSEGLTDAVFLGGVTGIFNIQRFLHPGMTVTATAEGTLERLRLTGESQVYEFVYDSRLNAVVGFVHYQESKKKREITRSDFKEIGGLQRASRTLYRDYLEDREITVLVGKEEVNLSLAENAFQILLPNGL